jgi:hypothetical protein
MGRTVDQRAQANVVHPDTVERAQAPHQDEVVPAVAAGARKIAENIWPVLSTVLKQSIKDPSMVR